MTPTTFVGFAAATALVAAAAALSVVQRHEGKLEVGAEKRFLPGLVDQLNAVAAVEIVHGKGQLTIARAGAGWTVAEMGGYPANAEKVRKTAVAVAELRIVAPKTNKEDRLGRLDLEDAKGEAAKSKLVRLKDAGGRVVAEAIVGKRKFNVGGVGKEGVYVRKPGESQSWLVEGTLDLTIDSVDWVTREVTNIAAKRVSRVATTAPDGTRLVVFKTSAADARFAIENPPADDKLVRDAAQLVDDLATGLEGVEFTTIAKEADKDFKGAEVSKAEARTFDGLVVDVVIYEKDAEAWGTFKASADPAAPAATQAAALNAKLAGWTYRLPAHKVKALKTNLRDIVAEAGKPKAS